jgi:hypothetical protein
MFTKTTIALALVIAAISSAVAAPKQNNGWPVGTDPSAQIRNYLQHDRGSE